jgi:hypothetical protein
MLISQLFCTKRAKWGEGEGESHWKGLAMKTETFLGPEKATSETHVYKITNVPVFLYGSWT